MYYECRRLQLKIQSFYNISRSSPALLDRHDLTSIRNAVSTLRRFGKKLRASIRLKYFTPGKIEEQRRIRVDRVGSVVSWLCMEMTTATNDTAPACTLNQHVGATSNIT